MRNAFSLIEMALVVVVVGLMVAFGLTAFDGSNDGECYEKTEAQLQTIDAALKQFVATHRRLPKPAYADKGSSSPQFGYEASDGPDGDTAPDAPNTLAYAAMVPAGMANAGGTILLGALPHATLNLPNAMASDCWGSKFTYAVTNALTSNNDSTGYPSSAPGTVMLNGGTLGAPQSLSTALSYVVLSHGSDRYGATPIAAADGTARDCNGSSEPKIDRENCNHDGTFFNSPRNTGNAGNYFDDLLVFSSKMQSREPCPAQSHHWMAHCTGDSGLLVHGASGAISNTAPGYTGMLTVHCYDGTLTPSSPSCTPVGVGCPAAPYAWGPGCSVNIGALNDGDSVVLANTAPGYSGNITVDCTMGALSYSSPSCSAGGPTCASEGLNEGEGNYDGACNLTSCCGGSIVYQILPGPCPAGAYSAGAGNCPAGCDNDPSDGLTGGQKYCSGVVVAEGSGDYVCFNGIWGASYSFSCNAGHAAQCQSGAVHTNFTTDTSGCSPPPDCSNGDTFPTMGCSETAQCICN